MSHASSFSRKAWLRIQDKYNSTSTLNDLGFGEYIVTYKGLLVFPVLRPSLSDFGQG